MARMISDPWLISLVLLVITTPSVRNDSSPAPVFRVDPGKEFTRGLGEYYRLLRLDKETSSVYVGAMNKVYRLWTYNISSTDPNFYAERNLMPYSDQISECSFQHQDDKQYQCQNHVRVLTKLKGNVLYVCGTNAYKPAVSKLDALTLAVKESNIDGAALCQVNPDGNSTAVWVEDGNPGNMPSMYAGSVADKSQNDRLVYRPALRDTLGTMRHRFMRTMPTNTQWLNEPEFVGSFDLGDQYVYFFFREPALEFTNCGKAVYSRVARVCKNDMGGEHVLKNTWATFLKARLNCSIPGEFPFYFDEIQSVEKEQSGNDVFFYATFTTSLNGFYGSAVCVYNLMDINTVFDQGRFKELPNLDSAWRPVPTRDVPTPRPGQCVADTLAISPSDLQFIKSHPLLDDAVPPYDVRKTPHPLRNMPPLYYKRDAVFTHLAVDEVKGGDGRLFTVVFVGTATGEIYKILHDSYSIARFVKVNPTPARLLAIYKLPREAKIRSMQLLPNEYLYVAQDPAVSQVAVDQCSQYKLCSACTADPYCSWATTEPQSCTHATTSHRYAANYVQLGRGFCPDTVKQYVRKLFPGDSVHLECPHPAGQQIYWLHNNRSMAMVPGRHLITVDSGLVMINITKYDIGSYACVAQRQPLVHYNITVDDINCKRPDTAQEYANAYREWCREFQEYKNTMVQWRRWHEENAQCGGAGQEFNRIAPPDVTSNLNALRTGGYGSENQINEVNRKQR